MSNQLSAIKFQPKVALKADRLTADRLKMKNALVSEADLPIRKSACRIQGRERMFAISRGTTLLDGVLNRPLNLPTLFIGKGVSGYVGTSRSRLLMLSFAGYDRFISLRWLTRSPVSAWNMKIRIGSPVKAHLARAFTSTASIYPTQEGIPHTLRINKLSNLLGFSVDDPSSLLARFVWTVSIVAYPLNYAMG